MLWCCQNFASMPARNLGLCWPHNLKESRQSSFCLSFHRFCSKMAYFHAVVLPSKIWGEWPSTNKSTGTAYFCHWGIFNVQICLNGWIVPLRSIIPRSTMKLIKTNECKLSSFYFIEFKEKTKKVIKNQMDWKNRPKSTKLKNLKKPGPQPIKNRKITAENTLHWKQAKATPDSR